MKIGNELNSIYYTVIEIISTTLLLTNSTLNVLVPTVLVI